jgi:hypothetical protein
MLKSLMHELLDVKHSFEKTAGVIVFLTEGINWQAAIKGKYSSI